FVYDLVILTIAQAFLLRHFAKVGVADAVEIRGLALANCLVLLFAKTPVPLGIIASAIVMALILHRVWIERSATTAEQLGAPLPVCCTAGRQGLKLRSICRTTAS